MITVEMKGADRYAEALDRFAKKGVPFAARNALNAAAFETRRVWVEEMGKRLVLRNTWTTRSIQVEKAKGTKVTAMEAKVGTPLGYMATQEEGGTEGKKGKYGKPIPTTSAAGQAMKARARTKQVRPQNYMSAIHLANRVSGPRYRRNAAAIAIALRRGTRVAFIDLGKRKGIVRVMGDKKPRVRMLWDLSKASVKIPKHPTLEPALKRVTPQLVHIYSGHLEDQLKRAKVRGY